MIVRQSGHIVMIGSLQAKLAIPFRWVTTSNICFYLLIHLFFTNSLTNGMNF